ncbi:MAG: RNA-binding S4 domain-containing protein, partial [Bacteroidales bacterium]
MEKEVRLDKWLWSVRLYKTRALASDACRLGKVIINNIPAKASYQVKIGDIINVNIEQIHRKVKVIALVNNRQGAKLVDKYMEDLTPKE